MITKMNTSGDSDTDDSDYVVENIIKPDKVSKRIVNDDSADLLGNFDDAKRRRILEPESRNDEDNSDDEEVNDYNKPEDNNSNAEENPESNNDDDDDKDNQPKELNKQISTDQLNILLRGASKKNRFVLYVTNLNFDTTKEDLENLFSSMGAVKNVRIPKKRKGGFAFVEMSTIEGFQKALELHNTELHGRIMKVQISEGGKKKSANKKNILRQKNRKLAEMRNETKRFSKSGKNYDKNIKKEKQKEALLRKRWRKNKPLG